MLNLHRTTTGMLHKAKIQTSQKCMFRNIHLSLSWNHFSCLWVGGWLAICVVVALVSVLVVGVLHASLQKVCSER